MRLSPRLKDSEPTPGDTGDATTNFFTPSKALVNMAAGWSDSEDGDILPRNVPEATGKKRKLERHFLDRGVWVHVGMLALDPIGNGIFCDFFPVVHGWPTIVTSLQYLLPVRL